MMDSLQIIKNKVGLNTDASVRRLKGESRPINDENTLYELIKAVHPNVLVKGYSTTGLIESLHQK